MDNININNIFNRSYKNRDKTEPLNVKSLFDYEKRKIENKTKFSVEKLISVREEKKKKIIEEYKKNFNLCLNKIDATNDMGGTKIVFNIIPAIFGCPGFEPYECTKYIEERLKKLHMDTMILSEQSLFVSWSNIEENKKDALSKGTSSNLNK